MANDWLIKVPFYGKWSMKVIGKNADFKQRVVIEESLSSDGFVDGVVGQSVPAIDGPKWLVFIESSGNNGTSWNASRTKRVPGVISPDGLVVTLFSDDVVTGGSDSDFNDLIVQFVYLNPEVNPPGVPPYNFTVPPESFRPTLPPDKPKCRCECTCRKDKRPRRKCNC